MNSAVIWRKQRCCLLVQIALLFCVTLLTLFPTCKRAAAIPSFSTASAARSWADLQLSQRHYAAASAAYSIEAKLRRAQGDEQAAEVEELKASRYATSVALAVPVPLVPANVSLAKLEPAQGCYVGVRDEQGTNASNFVARLGRPISITYDYIAYGQPFPLSWARHQAESHRLIQIAWEPADIHAVLDDEYLESFAEDVSRCGTGVFIRFGGEMNGAWTTWGEDPVAYVAAFRTVHDVMARFAPNAAMVWAPNQIPLGNLDRYYPGDSYVDWVGISLYTVRYYDDNLSEPAFNDSPATMIAPFYSKYASRKPLCVVECGISRRSRVEGTDADGFAAARITDLMNAIRVRFPRLKMICFFDRNNITGAVPNRRLNDYSLPEGSLALDALKQAATDPYFIDRYYPGITSPYAYEPLTRGMTSGYSGNVIASIITYDLHPCLELSQAGKTQTLYRPYIGRIAASSGPVSATVFDSRGNVASSVIISD